MNYCGDVGIPFDKPDDTRGVVELFNIFNKKQYWSFCNIVMRIPHNNEHKIMFLLNFF